ncbi:MAG TPA: methyltransferase domain-containing protein [Lacunisphaera sp.]|nr:methyltransferase domain-containing protein [Lacunisphaera sp.]
MLPSPVAAPSAHVPAAPRALLPACILVQASSRSWTGGSDGSVSLVDGRPAFVRTIEILRSVLPNVPVVVIAPAFDADGALPALLTAHGCHGVAVRFSHDQSPLRRMLDATAALADDAVVLRVNGMNMFVDPRTVREMVTALADSGPVDCYKLADDYPAVLCVDFYRVGALRRAHTLLPAVDEFHIHVKHFLSHHAGFIVREHPRRLHYTPAELIAFKEQFRQLQQCEHAAIEEKHVQPLGDQLKFHYELAARRLPPGARVLDIGSGSGFGAAYLHGLGHAVIAGDVDPRAVAHARARYREDERLAFHVMDAERTGLPDNAVDAITTFETIEHVGSIPDYLREMHRVVRPGGLVFLSTPQNCFGQHPISCWHHREFTAEEFRTLVATTFDVVDFIGIKQGRVHFPGDPIGNNSFLVARPRK